MPKLCRACQKLSANRGGVCDACRRRTLEKPDAPTPHPGIWNGAGLLIGLLSIASGLLAAVVFTQHRHLNLESRSPSAKSALIYQIAMVAEQGTRKVYPYSIVPGGAENLAEAKRAMSDPSVKSNYAGVDYNQLRQVKLTRNLSGYVSYLWGEKTYWTSNTLTLRAGEMVFTDGVHLVRGRCLNPFSAVPMQPIQKNEPTEKVLGAPVEMPVIAYSFRKLPVQAPELPPSPEELTPTVPIFPPGGVWFPLVPIIPPIQRHATTVRPWKL